MPLPSKLSPAGRLTFFYGWRIVALGYLLNLMTAGLNSSTFSVFVKPMGDDLGWSRSSTILATTTGTVAAAVFGHFLGTVLDKRHGARLLPTGGMITIGVCAILFGFVQETWHLYGLFFIGGAVGLYAYPGLLTPTIVSKWFVRRRGMAISLASMGLPSSGILLSPYANLLIAHLGWRDAWMILGITALVVTVPLCALFMRRRPKDIGLRTDNDEPASRLRSGELARVLPDEHSWTIRQAIATRSFWLILISSSLGMMCFMGILINFFAFATDTDAGFTTNQASIAFAVILRLFPYRQAPVGLPLRPHRHSNLHRFHVYGSCFWYRPSHQRRCILDAFALGYRFRDRHLRYCPPPSLSLGLILWSYFPRLHKRRDISRRFPGPGLGPPLCGLPVRQFGELPSLLLRFHRPVPFLGLPYALRPKARASLPPPKTREPTSLPSRSRP